MDIGQSGFNKIDELNIVAIYMKPTPTYCGSIETCKEPKSIGSSLALSYSIGYLCIIKAMVILKLSYVVLSE